MSMRILEKVVRRKSDGAPITREYRVEAWFTKNGITYSDLLYVSRPKRRSRAARRAALNACRAYLRRQAA